MVSRCARSVRRQVLDYHTALNTFGHNAKRFLISGFLQGLGGGVLATVFGIYIKSAGMSERTVGDTEAAVALAAAAVALLGTPLIASFGYRYLMVGAMAIMLVSRLGMASMPIAGVLVGLSLAVGLGDGFLRAIGSAFMVENSGEAERGHLFSIEFLMRVSAGVLGGLIGGMLPTFLSQSVPEVAAYQWTIAFGALVVGAGTIPMLSLKDRAVPNASVRDAYARSFGALRSWRTITRLVLPQAAIALGGGMVIPFVPLFLKESLGANIGQIGAILGLSSVVTAAGVFGIPVVARKLGLPTGVALLQGLSVPFLAMVSLATSLPVAIGALWIRGALMNMAGPLYNQLALDGVADEDKPIISGWMFFGLNVMWFLGNVIGGRLMEADYKLPYIAAVVLYAIGAGATYLVWRSPAEEARVEPLPAPLGDTLPEAT